jgi:competence protein ComEA
MAHSPYTPPPYGNTPQQYQQTYAQPQNSLTQQQTMPQSAIVPPSNPLGTGTSNTDPPPPSNNRRKYIRIFALTLALVLIAGLYFLWHTSSAPSTQPAITQQNFGRSLSNPPTTSVNSSNTGGDIQVYVTGAVKHPGVYPLPPDARVYQLLQAAGGPLPNANLVALNLAAKLTDGQEVYVTILGETPPTYLGGVPGPGTGGTPGVNTGSGQLVNINTASVDDLRQNLHISSTSAQNIVNYRLQHGNYTSVDELLQVVSRSIYDRIKDMVTI